MKRPGLVAIVSLVACGGSGTPGPAQRTSVAVAQAGDLRVELLTDARLEVGMTPLYVKVTDPSGAAVGDAAITMAPLMRMGDGKQHAAPVIVAPELWDGSLYGCAVVFSMPSSAMDSWDMKVTVQRPGRAAADALFPNLTVADTGRAKSFVSTDGAAAKYVVSLNFAAPPSVGANPVVVTVHRMVDMMTFVPVDDAAIALEPQMPSMGHGSSGSVNPTPTSLGRYSGKLSFNMPGEWQTKLSLTRAGQPLGSVTIATSF
jgi:hypothetical protein